MAEPDVISRHPVSCNGVPAELVVERVGNRCTALYSLKFVTAGRSAELCRIADLAKLERGINQLLQAPAALKPTLLTSLCLLDL